MDAQREAQRLEALAEILMGAAHADGDFDTAEAAAIEAYVAEFAQLEVVPDHVLQAIARFDPASYDPYDAIDRFGADDPEQGERLLRMVLRIVDADTARDVAEEHYFFALAGALGLEDQALMTFLTE